MCSISMRMSRREMMSVKQFFIALHCIGVAMMLMGVITTPLLIFAGVVWNITNVIMMANSCTIEFK